MKKKKTASRILAATLSTAVTLSFVPVSAFAEQLIETETMIEEESFLLNETNYESETEPVQETVSEETMQELSPPEAEPIQADFPVLGDEANEGTEETAVKKYQISVSIPEEMQNICFAALNGNYTSLEVSEGETVTLTVEVGELENSYFRIGSITAGNTPLFNGDENQTHYQNDIQVTGDMADENGTIHVNVELVQYYLVQFSYNSQQGTVSSDEYTVYDESNPEKVIGTVQLNQDENAVLTVTPAEQYAVDKIKIDGISSSYTNPVVLEENKNHTVEVLFKTKEFSVTGAKDNAKDLTFRKSEVTVQNNGFGASKIDVSYGGNITGCVELEENQHIDSIRINHELYTGNIYQKLDADSLMTQSKDLNNCYFFDIENVTTDIFVEVEVSKNPGIQLTLPERYEYPCYSSDVTLDLQVQNPENLSGFTCYYWIEAEKTSERSILNLAETNKITVKSEEYNQENIVVHVEFSNPYGSKITTESEPFSINSVKPEIKAVISNDNNSEENGNYYNEERTISVQIQDEPYTIPDFKQLAKYFQIKKNGQDIVFGEDVTFQYNEENPEIIDMTFKEDGTYTWTPYYMNLAGMISSLSQEAENSQNGRNLYEFIIDKTKPTGSVKIEQNQWSSLLEKITFGLFGNHEQEVTIETQDNSPVKTAYYLKTGLNTEAMIWAELEKISDAEWTEYTGSFKISPSEAYVIYARLTDAAGNRIYLSSDGYIIENQESAIEFDYVEQSVYTEDVSVQINVSDQAEAEKADIFSGIKQVEYWLEYNGEEEQEHRILYQTEEHFVSEQSFQITIPAQEYTSDVILHVKALDCAGNVRDEQKNFNIDITSPKVSVSYTDAYGNVMEPRNEKYFNGERIAIIRIEERNFNEETAGQYIKINGRSLDEGTENETKPDWQWAYFGDKHWETTGDIHETRVIFTENKEYDFDVAAVDDAAHLTEMHTEFTIDKNKPIGYIVIDEKNAWNYINDAITAITFGLFKNHKMNVKIEFSGDNGIEKTEYCLFQIQKDEVHHPMKLKELQQLPDSSWSLYTGEFSVDKDENVSNIIYARIIDYAGNVTYINSEGYIYDDEPCEIMLMPDTTNAVRYSNYEGEDICYHDDVTVTMQIKDYFPYSGIQSANYTVTVNGNPRKDGIKDSGWTKVYADGSPVTEEANREEEKNKQYEEWTKTIVIPKEYNSSAIELEVTATDFAGNEKTEILPLDIDITAPEVNLTYDNNNGNRREKDERGVERYYFTGSRTATIQFKERSKHFSREKALESINIYDIYGKIYNKNGVTSTFQYLDWEDVEGTMENHDDDIHILKIYFYGDANYHMDINYTDLTELSCSKIETDKKSVGLYDFTVDNTPPFGKVFAQTANRAEEWGELVSPLHFGFWSKSDIQVFWNSADDTTSVIKSIEYYRSSSTVPLTESELDKIKTWSPFSSINLSSNGYCTVYVKITDMAGNIAYISTDGLIVDDSAPYDEMMPPDISMTPEQAESGIYSGDVTVSVTVDDPLVNNAYSGLQEITYYIKNMGEITESGTLYKFDEVNPQHSDLLKTWNGEITVSSELNNSNDVELIIEATDNAKNISVETLPLSIDTTAPEITVSFDNNRPQNGLFRNSRKATIRVTERNFNSKYTHIIVNGEERKTISWTPSGGTGNGDNTVWTAEVPFSNDGEYTLKVDCSDLAANKSGEVKYAEGTVLPSGFTIDATNPVITVDFTDEDSNPEGEYYKANRTATITIDELHFNHEKASAGIIVKGNNEGKPVSTVLSDWKDEGTKHTATIQFTQDAKYELSVSYTDEAGNSGTKVDNVFYIDNIDPEVEISVNDKKSFDAYAGEVIPVISYQDTNLDNSQVEIVVSGDRVDVSAPEIKDDTISFTLTRETKEKTWTKEWTGKIEDITDEKNGSSKVYGKKLIFDNFPSDSGNEEDKVFDDIYTISVLAKDKSGRMSNSKNPDKNSLTFSVNRFGSTYNTDEIQSLLGTYVQDVQDIVISEINPNALKEHSVKLFKNEETLTLKENDDYDLIVSGEEKQWHEYTYKIHKSVFEDDGNYEIRLNSVDKAGNISENSLETKESSINFIVDKTPPVAIISNLENHHSYYVNENQMTIMMTANDNIRLSEVAVYLDDENNTYQHWNEKEIETNFSDGEFQFEIEAEPLLASKSHQLKVICKDASGRKNDPVVIDDFKIIINESVRPWIYTGIGVGTAAVVITAVLIRRRKKNEI